MQQHSPAFPGTVRPAFPETEQLKCPRCDSTNTKFCYYNNYNLLQPRHFCKSCRRYWTKGGSLRNIPVGGGSRKNTKRSSSSSASSFSPDPHGGKQSRSAVVSAAASPEASQSSAGKEEPAEFYAATEAPPGSFSSLLNGQFGNLMEGLDGSGSGYRAVQSMDAGNGDGFVGFQQEGNSDSGCWAGGGNGWPDLAMYTPGSSFQQIN